MVNDVVEVHTGDIFGQGVLYYLIKLYFSSSWRLDPKTITIIPSPTTWNVRH